VAAFISSQKTEHGIDHITSCRALGVSQSWFYKWKNRIGQDAPGCHRCPRLRPRPLGQSRGTGLSYSMLNA
jgi:hypothetical protein